MRLFRCRHCPAYVYRDGAVWRHVGRDDMTCGVLAYTDRTAQAAPTPGTGTEAS